eukprot:scaffold207838_cov19-Tisochrysis_lutea.AAC.2
MAERSSYSCCASLGSAVTKWYTTTSTMISRPRAVNGHLKKQWQHGKRVTAGDSELRPTDETERWNSNTLLHTSTHSEQAQIPTEIQKKQETFLEGVRKAVKVKPWAAGKRPAVECLSDVCWQC